MTGRSRAGPRRGASISRPAAVIFHARAEPAATKTRPWRSTVESIARAVGYSSEYAFNRAFARHRGQPPGRYRRRALATPAG